MKRYLTDITTNTPGVHFLFFGENAGFPYLLKWHCFG
jgi:hypothetical protein